MRKNCYSDLEKLLKFRAKDREFAKFLRSLEQFIQTAKGLNHGLRTPNEGINQRNLKNWADVADKICCRHT